MDKALYPLVFVPILKDRIWGGTKLRAHLDKDTANDTTGESWELSAVDGDVSRVRDGIFKDRLLTELLEQYPEEILGTKVYKKFGAQFPLLFKFLDAKDDLSIQVHPNDELAKKRHNSFGKTEMWYVMQADEGARIIVGFKEKSSPEQYLQHLKDKNLIEILNEVQVSKGDVFFLETGTIHAIGKGIVIAEIQQTSDITYRIYDWDRRDADGKARELHVDQALEAMNYDVTDTKKEYSKEVNKSNAVVHSPYFTTSYLPLSGEATISKDGSSFNVYICTEGSFSIEAGGNTYNYKKGDTVLVPAAIKEFRLSGEGELLEVFID